MSQRWITVARVSDIRPGRGRKVVVEGREIALFNVGGEFLAVDDTCTHEKASLSEGDVYDGIVECPRHGARFDLRTGRVLSLPAVKDLRTYSVLVEGDEVKITLE